MTNPPIPPGCERWQEVFARLRAWYKVSKGISPALNDAAIDGLEAALYRTKWLDEAARHHDPCVGEGYCNIDGPCKGCEAVNMAAEWRNWGER